MPRGANGGEALCQADLPANILERLQPKILVTPSCWIWTAAHNSQGYGVLGWRLSPKGKYRHVTAHRVTYVIFRDDLPNGVVLRHSCDQPACCQPSHLVPGTQKENAFDALVRGQSHTLDWAAVSKIRLAYRAGSSIQSLAAAHSVSVEHIREVLHNRKWADPAHTPVRRLRYGTSPLLFEDVVEARELRAKGWTVTALAKRYGTPQSTMSEALSGKTWNY